MGEIIDMKNAKSVDMNKFKKELDEVVKAEAEVAEGNEDISHLREIQHTHDDPNAGKLVAKEETYKVDDEGKPVFVTPANDDNGLEEEMSDDSFQEAFKENMTESYGLSDQDAAKLLDAIMAYKKDKTVDVYSLMPMSVKSQILKLCADNGIPATQHGKVAREMATQFIMEASHDKTFIDFEKALEKAMKIPSLTDMYNDHLNETMDKRLPAMADAIEATDPEKAKMLRGVGHAFELSMTFKDLFAFYNENSRIRKLVRRDFKNVQKFADEVNYINQENEFNMPDATKIANILVRVFESDEELDLTDVMKFLTLVFSHITYTYGKIEGTKDAQLIRNAYVYYLLKNMVMLSYSDEKSKSSFSSELINNMKVVMYYIRAKEEEFSNGKQ